MEISQIIYIVEMLAIVDMVFNKFAPSPPGEGIFYRYLRSLAKCLILFLLAYVYITNSPQAQ